MPRESSRDVRYGGLHRRERRKWERVVQAGDAVCARCGRPIVPGSAWHLDHEDSGEARDYLGPSHAACNQAAGARRALIAQAPPPAPAPAARRAERANHPAWSRHWHAWYDDQYPDGRLPWCRCPHCSPGPERAAA